MGAKAKRMRSKVKEWMIPARGVLAPVLILVAVLAIAPVAGIPPNNTAPIFAIPCAISSQFDLCLFPVIPSATTADRRDSIPAKNAMVKAAGIKLFHSSKEIERFG